VRYLCFRIQTEALGGAPAADIPEGFKEHYEMQNRFTGWKNFACNWDIDTENPKKVVYRKFTIYEEWNAVLRSVVPELPVRRVE
jgi:hypothetical protein